MTEIQKKYTINGVEYKSLDEVPPEHRASIETFEKITNSGKSGFFQVFKLLWSLSNNPPKADPPNTEPEPTIERSTGGFFSSVHFKLMMVVLVLVSAGYFFLTAQRGSNPDEESRQASEEAEKPSSITDSKPVSKYALLIDDPNEPPYRAFIGLYENDVLLLQMDLPSAELQEKEEENVILLAERLEGETDIETKKIGILWKDQSIVDDRWTTITIGEKTFYTISDFDYSDGERYRAQHYVYPFRGGNLVTTVVYRYRTTGVTDTTPKFDIRGDLANIEAILATLTEVEPKSSL